ncbi:MAG: oxygen-independent coproporphyrinogen III oxidase [Betaproteobacteria bacterium RBG_16_64_18]|nr:MAG: oxygen-independent coproporphyrinogen III oxidase [Betaproteobacteria bacterium RBG_16_64_18]OGA07673.1 MAG: oxygen-independent coproporphyrinogen III oxidase [Betaproteobacteria bacterium RIFCSPLOWO2_02_FULL_65_20]OGA38382.1 MAG: oxygen-independent coproporphyrinogen III oxidase [Betaproteobacteria bacterium RIFCSPLOWO2_12_FULL_65_110]
MSEVQDILVVDPDLLRNFDRPGPRYTSYPTADRLVEAFGPDQYRVSLEKRVIGGFRRPLSLYIHLPFCDTICYYCGCNKIITRDHGRSAKYLRYLRKEIELVSDLLGRGELVTQLHWGGGSPTFLNQAELAELMQIIRDHFSLAPDGEYSIEVDPRSANRETIALLGSLGFNRISVGVQDFDAEVQRAVNRIQSEDQTRAVISAARVNGFQSVNLDLIYGLPKQNAERFARTLEKVLAISPERIALYNYAHLPTVFKPQRRINEAELPNAEGRIELFTMGIRTLTEAGYVYIGMDHFAKPEDELAVAQRRGHLHRNFQGYSTRAECDLIGLGISAIGSVGPAYIQNFRTLDEYYDSLDHGVLPVMRGLQLNSDDLVRRAVIQAIMCHFALSFRAIEIAHLIDFRSYFATELRQLEEYRGLGLVEIEDEWITVTPRGRLMVRAICMVFDQYLRNAEQRARYSKVI